MDQYMFRYLLHWLNDSPSQRSLLLVKKIGGGMRRKIYEVETIIVLAVKTRQLSQ